MAKVSDAPSIREAPAGADKSRSEENTSQRFCTSNSDVQTPGVNAATSDHTSVRDGDTQTHRSAGKLTHT